MLLLIQVLAILILLTILLALYRDEFQLKKKVRFIALLEKFWDGRERRRSVRLGADVEIRYKELRWPADANGGRAVNLSDTGMRLLIDKKMSSGTRLELSFTPPHKSNIVRVIATVVWCNEAKDKEDLRDKRLFHIGVRISEVREPAKRAFADYMSMLENTLKQKSAGSWGPPENHPEPNS
ncbi:MAG: PilZ domain-containing protein [Candidatus Omnitrophota bacterium]